jgi:hypothetical protein
MRRSTIKMTIKPRKALSSSPMEIKQEIQTQLIFGRRHLMIPSLTK